MSRTARLGTFIVGTLAILVLGIFIIGSKKSLFTSTYTVRTTFANVVGLSTGADVRVGGVHVGTVRAIELPKDSGDKVTVFIDLNDSTHGIVKRDSVASIETEGLLGNQYIAVSFGSARSAVLKNGETIASLPPLEMSQLFDKANGLLTTSRAAMDNISLASANLQSVTAKIDHGDGTVGALINDRAMYNDIKQTAVSAQGIAISAQAGVVDFQENMEAMKHNFLLRGYFKSRGYEDSSAIGKDEIVDLPAGVVLKDLSFKTEDMFTARDSAQIKNPKALNSAGEFLASSQFGVAVVVVSSGSTGDVDSEFVLAQARAMVIRDYLVDHYSFDDAKLKTIALRKQRDVSSEIGWGVIKVAIYPVGTLIPAAKAASAFPSVGEPGPRESSSDPKMATAPLQ